jgi:hypothetical protein
MEIGSLIFGMMLGGTLSGIIIYARCRSSKELQKLKLEKAKLKEHKSLAEITLIHKDYKIERINYICNYPIKDIEELEDCKGFAKWLQDENADRFFNIATKDGIFSYDKEEIECANTIIHRVVE